MFRKNLLMASLIAAMALMTPCGGENGDKKETDATITVGTDSSESENETEEEEEVDPEEISKEDANALLEEKLDGLGCSAIYDTETMVGDDYYYTYTVIDSEENEMDQMLAVNAVSGEVYVYDLDADKVSDFKNFKLYNPDKDAKVSWEGSYKLDEMTVSLEPGDDNSFEFNFKDADGKSVFAGVAQVSGNSASYKDDDVSLGFSFETDGSLKIANNGNINAYAGIYAPAGK